MSQHVQHTTDGEGRRILPEQLNANQKNQSTNFYPKNLPSFWGRWGVFWVAVLPVLPRGRNNEGLSRVSEGEVRLSKNGQNIASLMHVDKTLPMWMFFDVYGNTQKIKSLGRCVKGQRVPTVKVHTTSVCGGVAAAADN